MPASARPAMRTSSPPPAGDPAESLTRRVVVVVGTVAGEHVEPEVVAGGPPHRMRVVDVALGVVPFGEQPRALQSVVVRLPPFRAARPREVHVVEDGLVKPRPLG